MMEERKVGPAGTIDFDEETAAMFGLMVLHVLSKKRSKSPLLKIEPEQRDDGLAEALFERLTLADEIIRYLITHARILDLDIFKDVMKDAARLYDAVLNAAKKKFNSISKIGDEDTEKATRFVYEKMKGDFRFIKPNHLDIDYNLSYHNEKREFVTRIVDIYFKTMGIKTLQKSKMKELMSNIIE
jgi:hypothetical protein